MKWFLFVIGYILLISIVGNWDKMDWLLNIVFWGLIAVVYQLNELIKLKKDAE